MQPLARQQRNLNSPTALVNVIEGRSWEYQQTQQHITVSIAASKHYTYWSLKNTSQCFRSPLTAVTMF